MFAGILTYIYVYICIYTYMHTNANAYNTFHANACMPHTHAPHIGLSHFTCHFIESELTVQLELILDHDRTIGEAGEIANKLAEALTAQIEDVRWADIHLELSPHHKHP